MGIKVTCDVKECDIGCVKLVIEAHPEDPSKVVVLTYGPDGDFEYTYFAADLIAAIKNCQNT